MYPEDFAPLRPHFENLASDDEDTRLDASSALLRELKGKSVETGEKVLERLLKGLASGRQSARVGFAVTLAELLPHVLGPDGSNGYRLNLTVPRLLELLLTHTQVVGNVSGQEERDHYLGRLFGLAAVLKVTSLRQGRTDRSEWIRVVDIVLELAKEKTWLREECVWALHATMCDCQHMPYKGGITEVIIERLCASQLARSPEGVAIWLSARYWFYPGVSLPEEPWRGLDPLHVKNVGMLAPIMREASFPAEVEAEGDEHKLQQRGMWKARPNYAWLIILATLYRDVSDNGRLTFRSFWRRVVDENLFAASASQERKHSGLMVFSMVIQDAPSHLLPEAFSQNLVRCLINHLAHVDRYLHRAATRCLTVMHGRVEKDPESAYELIAGLTDSSGSPMFDQLTKTKTIVKLLTMASDAALERIVQRFEEHIRHPSAKDVKAAESHRRTLVDLLVSIISSRKLDESSATWLRSVLSMLSRFAYLSPKESVPASTPPLSPSSLAAFRMGIARCLASLSSSKSNTASPWSYELVNYLRFEENSGRWDTIVDFDGNSQKVRKLAWKHMGRLEQVAGVRQALARTLLDLYSTVLLQLYEGEPDAPGVLTDLGTFCGKFYGSTDQADANTLELVMDLLLAIVSKPSARFRALAQAVFSGLSYEFTRGSLQLLYDVLGSSESAAGLQEVFDQDGQSNDGEEDRDASDESDDDVTMTDLRDGKSHGINGDDHASGSDGDPSDGELTSDDGSDSEDDESSGAELDDETAKLNAALQDIMGTKALDPTRASGDTGSTDDDDDEEMNDDQMFALDDQMARVFRERKKSSSKKQQTQEAKETMIKFKNRVLDFLQIYIKKEHSNPLSLTLVLPLLSLIRRTGSSQISARACTLVRDLTQRCKGRDIPAVSDPDEAWHVLEEIHDELLRNRNGSRAHTAACSQSSLMLVRILLKLDGDDDDSDSRHFFRAVVQLYGATQIRWVEQRGRAHAGGAPHASVFTDFVHFCAELGAHGRGGGGGEGTKGS